MQQYFREQLKKPKQVELPGEGIVNIPNDEMNLVFQLSHIYRHLFYEGIGLRQLLDYYYLSKVLTSTEGENLKKKVLPVIKDLGLTGFCQALMWVLGEVFYMPQEQMLAEPETTISLSAHTVRESLMIASCIQ